MRRSIVLILLSILFVSILVMPGYSSKQLGISPVHSRVNPSSLPVQPSISQAYPNAQQIAEPSSVLLEDNFESENGGFGSLNYFGLRNWNVTAGSVDLIGNGFADFLPGNGLYLDLDGTTSQAGTIESKSTFTLVPGTYRLEFRLAGSQLGDPNRVDVRLGDVFTETFTPPSNAPFTLIVRDIIVTTATSGKLEFQSFGADNMGFLLDNVRLLTDITEPRLFSITPDHGGNAGTVTATLGGINFPLESVNVRLAGQSQNDIVAINATVVSTTQIVATFDLTGATAGQRDVVVTLSTQESLTLQNAFAVEPGGNSQLWVDAIGRDTIRLGAPQTYNIVYGNRGNIDAVGVPLWIGGIPKDATLNIGFEVSAPVPLEGQEPKDWSQVPIDVETDNEKLLPLFVPLVPAGSTAVLRISLTIPTQRVFQLRAWVNRPFFRSPIDPQVIDCSLAIGNAVLETIGLVPGLGCGIAITSASAQSFIAAVQFGRNLPSAGTSVVVFSLVQVHSNAISKVISIAEECAGEEVPVLGTIVDAVQIHLAAIEFFDSCKEPFRKLSEKLTPPIRTVASLDPNDKVGSFGVGSQQHISGREPLRYAIYFENVETATAPAQEVVVTDQLDTAKLDLNTLSLGSIAFGNKSVPLLSGLREFSKDIDLRPENHLIVRINAKLDPSTGLLTWRFTSIDPVTGLPPEDPLAGFLPPNLSPPQGEGSVFFTVMPKQGLPTGTEVRNQASIVFDNNAAIQTPTWSNTLDNSIPTSNVHALTATACSPNLNVQWSGTDTGSGIRNYTIHVSDNGGPFTVWQSETSATSGNYPGEFGHTYAFYSVAQDQTGNTEEAPANPDAALTIDAPPPLIFTSAPANITVSTGQGATTCGAFITDTVLGTANLQSGCTPISVARTGVPTGNLFPVGMTTITYTATDALGNTASAAQVVTVIDNTPPVLTVPSPPAQTESSCQAVIPDLVSASTSTDNCGGSSTLTQQPVAGTVVGPGSHHITVTATDLSGNSKSATMTFQDIAAPSFLVSITPTTINRGNRVTLSAAFRNCDNTRQTVTLRVSLTSPHSNTLMLVLPVTLQAGQNGSFSIPLTIPRSTPIGLYTLRLDVYSGGIKTSTTATQLTVTP